VKNLTRLANNNNSSFYCICSNLTFDEIFDFQRTNNLPFLELINSHTRCNEGCGTCIEGLSNYLEAKKLLCETN
jgi:NAD(P)H-nitrite reductase large subunit